MLLLERPERIKVAFDDHHLVANAGLLLPATLALRLVLQSHSHYTGILDFRYCLISLRPEALPVALRGGISDRLVPQETKCDCSTSQCLLAGSELAAAIAGRGAGLFPSHLLNTRSACIHLLDVGLAVDLAYGG